VPEGGKNSGEKGQKEEGKGQKEEEGFLARGDYANIGEIQL